jgi:ATP-dependent Clp protease ATP-binding subunit ClpC
MSDAEQQRVALQDPSTFTEGLDAQAREIEDAVQLLLDAKGEAELDESVQLLALLGDEVLGAVARRVRALGKGAQAAAVKLALQLGALSEAGGAAAVSLLGQLLTHGERTLEEQVIEAMGQLGRPEGVRALLTWLAEGPDEDSLEACLDALSALIARAQTPSASQWVASVCELPEPELKEVQQALEEASRPELDPLTGAVAMEVDRRKLRDFGTLIGPEDDSLEPAFGRARVLTAMQEALSQTGNRSFVLVGPSGSGKTALLQQLCRTLGPSGPADLMLQTSSGLLMAGTRWLGEWQTRMRDLVALLRRNPRVVVYISDINHLIGAGTTVHSQENIADFLAPYIRRGDITLIGETTPQAMRRGLDQRPAFKRLLHTIQVEELLEDETRRVVAGVGQMLAQQVFVRQGQRLVLGPLFTSRLMEVADQFRASVARPGRAVDLLRQTVERALRGVARDAQDIIIEPHHVIETLVDATGIPKGLLDDRDQLDLSAVRSFFQERVLGQDEAVEAIVDLITLVKAGLTDPSKPMGVLFFAGPTGVGKTELAKALAEYLFASSERMIRLDMSEYMDFSSIERLMGSPHAPEWSPHRQGQLTGRIHEEPFGVVLLDEIEKAHKAVFDLLLQVMDDGRLTDAAGRVAYFTQSILVMTSNIGGSDLFQARVGFAALSGAQSGESLRRKMEEFFRPEFINRIDRIVTFKALERDDVQRIVRREVGRVLMRSGLVRRSIAVDLDPSVVDLLADKGFDPRYGARPLKRVVERLLLLPLGRMIVKLGERASGALLRLSAEGEQVRVEVIRGESATSLPALSADALAGFEDAKDPKDPKGPRPGRDARRVQTEYEALDARVTTLEHLGAKQGVVERKTLLIHLSGQPSFWDDPERARQVLSEIHALERLIVNLQRLRKRVNDLKALLNARTMRQDARLLQAEERITSIDAEATTLELSLLCEAGEYSRADAFLSVERLDNAHDADPDPTLALLEMYSQWAERHGLRADVFDVQPRPDGQLRAATLVIQGLCAYGILRAEAGIHRLIQREPSRRTDRTTAFCRVDILPLIEGGNPRLSPADLTFRHEPPPAGPSPLYQPRQRLILHHRGSDLTLTFLTPHDDAEAARIATEYLRARLHLSSINARRRPEGSADEGPVRTYTFGQHASARDDTTNLKTPHLDDLLRGDGTLDAFIRARLLLPQAPQPLITP